MSEQHRKQQRLATAVHFYRHQLLKDGVTSILTHAAHMGSFHSSMALHSQEQVIHMLIMDNICMCTVCMQNQPLQVDMCPSDLSSAPRASAALCPEMEASGLV